MPKQIPANLVSAKSLLISELLIILNIISNTLVSGHNSSQSLSFLQGKSHSVAKALTTMEKFYYMFGIQMISKGPVNTNKYIMA